MTLTDQAPAAPREATPAAHSVDVRPDLPGPRLALAEVRSRLSDKAGALQLAQAELAHVTRVMTMGELTASIAHEVNQPLAGVVANGSACLRWLATRPPNLDEARTAIQRIIRDGSRAVGVLTRVRALVKKGEPAKERLDVNGVIDEILALTEGEVRRNNVSLQTDLAANLPAIIGDRVQLQQVILNLIINGIEAMNTIKDRERVLRIRTARQNPDGVLVAVKDSGIGLAPAQFERIFEAFYTTKQEGLGMGLSISRSIVENHAGRLWASPNDGSGATFQFTIPLQQRG